MRDRGRFPFNKNHRYKFSKFSLVEQNASDHLTEFEVTCTDLLEMLLPPLLFFSLVHVTSRSVGRLKPTSFANVSIILEM